ncbi:MAG: glutathione S-transferase family protein [Proteobacteria bacterium]|nr:glutathione S-transferase family protein [Pseudomonadota bacterium]
MLELVGFAASNYYNVVKLALLEKGVPFEEKLAWIGETDPAASPLGKVPYLLTEQGPISESTVMLEYIEARYPGHPLLPADPYAAAKARELLRHLELHLELVARNLYPAAFFGGQVSDTLKQRIKPQLQKNIAAFGRLARFAPFVGGTTFTLADCAAAVHLPLVASCSKIVYGEDLLAALPVKDYLQRMGERPSVQQVNADRKTNTAAMLARMKATA